MKSFNEICRMTQMELKSYLHKYLAANQYKVVNDDGYLYAKGTVPVLLLAHMDTVHKNKPITINTTEGKISSPQGIGGDDRCGIYAIMHIIKEQRCSVLFLEDEEIGTIGASKFAKSKHINKLDVNYMVELDRKGKEDAVFYSCDNKDFTNFITKETGFKVAYGSWSDISVVAPAARVAAVNLSVGYYNQHTTSEYVVMDEMSNTIEVVKKLVQAKCEKPFEYVARKYEPKSSYLYGWDWGVAENKIAKKIRKDTEIELEVLYEDWGGDEYGEEQTGYGKGNTKAEAWLDFFTRHDEVCMAQVVDYSFF